MYCTSFRSCQDMIRIRHQGALAVLRLLKGGPLQLAWGGLRKLFQRKKRESVAPTSALIFRCCREGTGQGTQGMDGFHGKSTLPPRESQDFELPSFTELQEGATRKAETEANAN